MLKRFTLPSILLLSSLAFGFAYMNQIPRKKAPEGAQVYIISPKDGDTVTSPVTVSFGLKGMGVSPAGLKKKHTGHHHVLIDTGLPNLGLPVPADKNHIHFGGGQTQTELDLSRGTHTLQLLLADEIHVPHDPAIKSKQITITVK